MRCRNPIRYAVGLPFLLLLQSAVAEVMDAAPHGFSVRHEVRIDASRVDVYRAAVDDIGKWWSADHTVSGDAANLYMNIAVPGCFCEVLGDGSGLEHLAINFVNPGVMLRFNGGLGPLGLMGVSGNMTWEFEDAGAGTILTLQYVVGGYMPGGLDVVAGPVDGVLVDAMTRLKSYVETGAAGPADGPAR